MEKTYRHYTLGILASMTVVLIWSGWLVLSRAGMTSTFSAWDLGILRFGTATVIALPILLWRRVPLKKIFQPKILLPAFFSGSAYTLLSFAALKQSPTANAGIVVNGLIPIATISLLYIFTSRRPSHLELAVSALILLANILLLSGTLISFNAYLMFIAATFSLAFYMVAVPTWKLDPEVFFCAVPIVNALFTIPCWLLFDGYIKAPLQDILLQAVYQGIIVTIIAITLLTYAIRKIGSLTVSIAMSGVPAMTALLAYIILNESITQLHLIALILCSAGILLHALLNRPKIPTAEE